MAKAQEVAQRAYTVGIRLRRWGVRIASFYFGYKILHREVYEVETAEPLLIALGLWLCGIAPADIFDGLRKMGDRVTGEAAPPDPQHPLEVARAELESGNDGASR
jgi:hypothetical protein